METLTQSLRQGGGGEGHAVVGADALRQPEFFEDAGEDGFGELHGGGVEALAGEQEAGIAIGDGQWITVTAIPGFELTFEVGGPQLVRRMAQGCGFAGMADAPALALFRHEAVPLEDVADGGAMR
jgi:hypothetical protein